MSIQNGANTSYVHLKKQKNPCPQYATAHMSFGENWLDFLAPSGAGNPFSGMRWPTCTGTPTSMGILRGSMRPSRPGIQHYCPGVRSLKMVVDDNADGPNAR